MAAGFPMLVGRGTALYSSSGNVTLADNAWHLLTAVFSSTTSRMLYLDGQVAATVSAGTVNFSSTSPFRPPNIGLPCSFLTPVVLQLNQAWALV
jgi:hypothetical protein